MENIPPATAPGPWPMPQPVPKKTTPVLLIVAVIVIVAVLIIGAAALAAANSKKTTDTADNDDSDGSDGSDDSTYTPPPTTNPPTTNPPTTESWLDNTLWEEWTSDNQFMQPKDGNRFVLVTFDFTNLGSSDLYVNPYDFQMFTTSGLGYDYSWMVEYDLPDYMQPGVKMTCTLGFEIPIGAMPDYLQYDP